MLGSACGMSSLKVPTFPVSCQATRSLRRPGKCLSLHTRLQCTAVACSHLLTPEVLQQASCGSCQCQCSLCNERTPPPGPCPPSLPLVAASSFPTLQLHGRRAGVPAMLPRPRVPLHLRVHLPGSARLGAQRHLGLQLPEGSGAPPGRPRQVLPLLSVYCLRALKARGCRAEQQPCPSGDADTQPCPGEACGQLDSPCGMSGPHWQQATQMQASHMPASQFTCSPARLKPLPSVEGTYEFPSTAARYESSERPSRTANRSSRMSARPWLAGLTLAPADPAQAEPAAGRNAGRWFGAAPRKLGWLNYSHACCSGIHQTTL